MTFAITDGTAILGTSQDAPSSGTFVEYDSSVVTGWPLKLVDGAVAHFTEEDHAAEQTSLIDSQASDSNRGKRNKLIQATDFYALSDVVMTSEMTTYRQALRDLPTQAGWPTVVVWPTAP